MPNKNIIVFSCDSVFFPLLKGSILSLEHHKACEKLSLDIGFIDIGCTESELEWLKERNVTIVSFDKFENVINLSTKLVTYNKSQICRPYLPDVFTEHENIIWCDSDIWFQSLDGIQNYVDIVNQVPEKIVCCPFVDASYTMNYVGFNQENLLKFIQYYAYWYGNCYNPNVAEMMKGRTLFSSGLFAMHRNNPIWTLWKQDLNIVYNEQVINDTLLRHLAEQTAFNKVIYQTGKFVPVESTYNYNCHVGILGMHDNKVCIDYPPFRPIDAIHLTATGKMIKIYLDKGFLWDKGNYLSEDERQTLLSIGHY